MFLLRYRTVQQADQTGRRNRQMVRTRACDTPNRWEAFFLPEAQLSRACRGGWFKRPANHQERSRPPMAVSTREG
jgi:hypothetical protein